MDFANFLPIFNTVAASSIIALLTYIVYRFRTLFKSIDRHDRVLFGDGDIKSWEGVVEITLANRKYSINDRRAFLMLIQILYRNKVIEMDDELKEAIDTIKKQE